MRKVKTKKAWKSFEITKVKLNPEQAVLACCDTTLANRGAVGGDPVGQCSNNCTGGVTAQLTSS